VGYASRGPWSLNGDSVPFNDAVVQFIRDHHVPDVLIVARWDYYMETDNGTADLHRGLVATRDALQKAGARVWIMRQVPKYPWDVPKALASAVLHGRHPEELGALAEDYRAELLREAPLFDGLEKNSTSLTLLDPAALFVDGSGRCRVAQNGKSLYYDSDHVNAAGAMMLRPLFEPIFGKVPDPHTLARGQN
jgi:hypothetical protein